MDGKEPAGPLLQRGTLRLRSVPLLLFSLPLPVCSRKCKNVAVGNAVVFFYSLIA